jgi:PAS domain S-box-containing protein
LYFLVGKLGLHFASIQANTSAVWPPAGIALAACLLFGQRIWPAIFAGAFLVNVTAAGSVATSLGIGAGNTLEALAGGYLVNRFARGREAFNRPQDVFKFMGLAALLSTTVSATAGVTSLSLGSYASWSGFLGIWFTWWLGDAAGDLLVAPLVVLWCSNARLGWRRAQCFEAMALLVALAITGGTVFGGLLPTDIQRHPIDFLCIPVLIWAAFRFGPRETATVTFVLSAIAIVGTLHGYGPFAADTPNTALLLLQSFLGVTGLTSIAVAASVAQRRNADRERAGIAAIVDSSDDAIISTTLEGRITSWNASAERIFGYRRGQALGRPIGLIIPPDRLRAEEEVFALLRQGAAVKHFETVRLRRDGRPIHISLTVSPIKDSRGRVIGASSIARDISEHKRVTEALGASEEKFHEMAETVPDILFTGRPDGWTDYTNQRFYDYTGMPPGAAEGFGWVAAVHPDDAQRARERWLHSMRSDEPYEIEYRIRAADGTYRWFMGRSRPIRDSEGRIVKWFGVCTDIEEQKRAQHERERILEAEQFARTEAEAALSKLRRLQTVTDSALPELTLNEMLHELLARLRTALQGDTATVLLLEADTGALRAVASVGLEEEVEAGIQIPLGRGVAGRIAASPGGLIINDLSTVEVISPLLHERIKSIVGAPLKIEGRVTGVINVGSVTPRDFTEEHLDLIRLVAHRAALAIERTRLHEGERAAREAAEEANRAKDEFLAMLGHELRNPLEAIASSVQLLNHSTPQAEAALKAREIMGRQLNHLARLVDDLLDVARVTTGKIELNRQATNIAECLRVCVNALENPLLAYDLKVEAEPAWVDGDSIRLEQISTNLLRNAIKYTPAGGRIRLTARAENGHAVIRVEDSGVGISAELLPRIFDLFVQDQGGLDRSGGGLGIGLTLARRLVEMHGGSMEAQSAGEGQGSTFTVRLPLIAPPSANAGPAPRSADNNSCQRRVLIVEDNADSRTSLRAVLELSGHEIHEAEDGPSGVEQALALRPDIALIDIGLPSLDGYAVARQIRSTAAGRGIFLVALTGYSQPRDRQLAYDAGFDAHVVKPVDFQLLSALIAKAAPRAAQVDQAAAAQGAEDS